MNNTDNAMVLRTLSGGNSKILKHHSFARGKKNLNKSQSCLAQPIAATASPSANFTVYSKKALFLLDNGLIPWYNKVVG